MGVYDTIFDALNEEGVRYVVVGGVAVVLHGHVRFTKDVDLVLDLETQQVHAALRAFETLGLVPRLPVDADLLADPRARELWMKEKHALVFTFGDPQNPLRAVDVFLQAPMPFEELWERSLVLAVGRSTVRVASLADLIALKKQADRPIDADDVAALERIAALSGDDAP
jgi:hypothetical protein